MKRFLLPSLFAACLLLGAVPTSVGAASSPSTAQYVCLIVLDAGRPDYISKNLDVMPNMHALLRHARQYDRAWVGDLMSITPPGHAVIGTGSFPRNDGGIVNWDWGIHQTGKVSPTTQALENYQNGWVFKIIKQSGTPTLAGIIRHKYPKGLVVAGSGAHFHAAGPMGGPDASWIFSYQRTGSSWTPFTLGQKPVPSSLLHDRSLQAPLTSNNHSTLPNLYEPVRLGTQDTLVMKFGEKTVTRYKPRGLLLNLPEVDTVGHWSHSWYPEERTLYKSFDRNLGQLIATYKRAGIYQKTLFVITADHGMIQSRHRVLDRQAVLSTLKDQHADTILVNGGGAAGPTMTSIWLKDQRKNRSAAEAIWNKHLDNVSAIYYMQHTGNQYQYRMAGCTSCSSALVKAYNYLLSTEAGPTGEDIAILLRENARNSGLPAMRGRHGGADWGSQHITLIVSGPGVKPGISHHPARLADLAPTVERFMGITPDARDGVVLADAFQQPNAADIAAQSRVDATTGVYVNALMQRANHDIYLEAHGLLPNYVPAEEQPVIHWKRRIAVTIAGIVVLIGTGIFVAWAIAEVRRQGTGLQWAA